MDVLDKIEANQTGKSLEEVLTDGYQFDFGDYLGKGFTLFGKEAGYLIGFSLVYFVILIGSSMLLGSIGIPFGDTIFSILVGSALGAGIFAFMNARTSEFDYSFNNFFDGFKPPFWKNLVLAALIQMVISLVISLLIFIPFIRNNGFDLVMRLSELENMTDPDDFLEFVDEIMASGIFMYGFIGGLASLIITTMWCLTPIFILKRNMGAWQAMEASRKIVTKKLLHFIALMIVLVILFIIGALFCGVGLLVAYPVFCLVVYVAYSHIMEEPIRM
ncbi:MAG: hypothetical protein ACKVOK_12705 [Flavobacteriales bacterium]